MLVLGLESSCDETAAAVVTEKGEVLSNIVHSQEAVHAPYGGVVPELASRDHMRAILPTIEAALRDAGLVIHDIDGIAATAQPGLIGAVLVGLQTAKAVAWSLRKPFVGVDHLIGHLLAPFLFSRGQAAPTTSFPYIGLLASGGHTAIYRVNGPLADSIEELGATRDDAAGEAFDKFAKLLGLGYPGGPVVDKLAAQATEIRHQFPLPMRDSLEFSFSGLKSHVVRHLETQGRPSNDGEVAGLCAAFQRAVVETLTRKTVAAARQENLPRIVMGGGVACNRGLRKRLSEACEQGGIELCVTPPEYCTDNAAMIAYAGAQRLAAGETDGTSLPASSTSSLIKKTLKGGGKRRH